MNKMSSYFFPQNETLPGWVQMLCVGEPKKKTIKNRRRPPPKMGHFYI